MDVMDVIVTSMMDRGIVSDCDNWTDGVRNNVVVFVEDNRVVHKICV